MCIRDREALDADASVAARVHCGPTEAAVAAARPADPGRAEADVGVAFRVARAAVQAGVGGARIHVHFAAPALRRRGTCLTRPTAAFPRKF